MKVRLADSTRVLQDGHLLIGGAPLTVQRLTRPLTETTADTTLGRRWLTTGIGTPDLTTVSEVRPDQLTVVIPIHGTADQLVNCLNALANPPDLRVIVVDDASPTPLTDATMRLATNQGPAAARNAGLARVTTTYAAFIDADIQITSTDLLALARHFADPDIAAVAPRVQGTPSGSRTVSRSWSRLWQRYDAAFSALDLGPESGTVHPCTRISYLPSACLLARTDALTSAPTSGFDPDLRLGEDVDLIWRLTATGHRVRYDATITAHHTSRSTITGWLARIYDYGTSAAPLAQRHGSHVAPAVLSTSYAIAAAATLARHRTALPLAALAVARTARRLSKTMPPRTAAQLAGQSIGHAIEQEAAIVLRHWSPALLLALPFSPTLRRVTATALAVDTAATLARGTRGLDPLTITLGRRATDLAYGLGLWRGAWRARSIAALLPRGHQRRRQPPLR